MTQILIVAGGLAIIAVALVCGSVRVRRVGAERVRALCDALDSDPDIHDD